MVAEELARQQGGREGRGQRPKLDSQMSRNAAAATTTTAEGVAPAAAAAAAPSHASVLVGPDAGAVPPGAIKPGFKLGRETVEYNECPPFAENLVSAAFVAEMVGKFNNDDPEKSFADPSWSVFGKSAPDAKDKIKYMMAKRKREGFPIMEIMGYAEFEGISAAVRACLRACVRVCAAAPCGRCNAAAPPSERA